MVAVAPLLSFTVTPACCSPSIATWPVIDPTAGGSTGSPQALTRGTASRAAAASSLSLFIVFRSSCMGCLFSLPRSSQPASRRRIRRQREFMLSVSREGRMRGRPNDGALGLFHILVLLENGLELAAHLNIGTAFQRSYRENLVFLAGNPRLRREGKFLSPSAGGGGQRRGDRTERLAARGQTSHGIRGALHPRWTATLVCPNCNVHVTICKL